MNLHLIVRKTDDEVAPLDKGGPRTEFGGRKSDSVTRCWTDEVVNGIASGDRVYLHETKSKPSYYGGEILSLNKCYVEGWNPVDRRYVKRNGWEIRFKADLEGKNCAWPNPWTHDRAYFQVTA